MVALKLLLGVLMLAALWLGSRIAGVTGVVVVGISVLGGLWSMSRE